MNSCFCLYLWKFSSDRTVFPDSHGESIANWFSVDLILGGFLDYWLCLANFCSGVVKIQALKLFKGVILPFNT